jgi:hypothetical protein
MQAEEKFPTRVAASIGVGNATVGNPLLLPMIRFWAVLVAIIGYFNLSTHGPQVAPGSRVFAIKVVLLPFVAVAALLGASLQASELARIHGFGPTVPNNGPPPSTAPDGIV